MKILFAFTLLLFIANTSSSQGSQLKGAKTFTYISSLAGKSITDAKNLMKKNGLPKVIPQKDEDMKTMNYAFFANEEDMEEAEILYVLATRNSKVVVSSVDYDYNRDSLSMYKDLEVLKAALIKSGFSSKPTTKNTDD